MRICPKATTLLALSLAACVDTAPRKTAEDTGTPDTVVDTSADTADAAEVSNDLVEHDGADTAPKPDGTTSDGSTGDVIGTCGTSADCADLPVGTCQVPFCDDGTCVAITADTACDDGDPCTYADFCDQGICTGLPISCDDLAPDCWVSSQPGAACVPFVGCPGTGFPAGSECDNGEGPEGGVCVNGWRVPPDACDGAGMCVDPGFAPPTATLHPLAGTWHVVLSSAPSDAPLHTLRGRLVFGQSGDLSFDEGASTNPVWLGDFDSGEADFCAGVDGVVDLALGEHTYRGFADPEAGLLVFGSLEDDQALGVAVRPTGLPEEVGGTYHLISTALFGAGETAPLITWQGTIDFKGGCVENGGTLATSPGLGASYTFAGGEDRCLSARGGGLHQLSFGLRLTPESPPFDIFWLGSIGARGDVLLFTREDGSLRYGTILLVRDRAPASVAELNGSWGFASQWNGAGAGDEAGEFFDHRLDLGVLDLGLTPSSLGGYLLGGATSAAVGPGWWQPGTTSARYHHRISFGGVALAHTGWIAPSGHLIVAWRALDPSTPNSPSLLGITPAEGSLFVAVRRNMFDLSSGPTPR